MKTLKEVLRDIKKGETWETVDGSYKLKSITREEGSKCLEFNCSDETRSFYIDPNQEFVLKIKSYDFNEAYVELLNGNVIESESGNIFIMQDEKIYKIEGIDHFPFTFVECSNIECADILGKWYIFDK